MKQTNCNKCKKHIDKTDCNNTYITITRKWFMLNNKKVKGRKITLCDECGLNLLQENDL